LPADQYHTASGRCDAVTGTLVSALRRVLAAEYGGLKRRLARRLRSTDLAGEVLHEAWLRLDRMEAASGAVVENPTAYLYRVALNVATDRQRDEQRRLVRSEVEMLLRNTVDELDPARVAEARSELLVLASALEGLSPRRRAVFIASRVEGQPHKLIAERLGVTVRIVDRELKAALDHFGMILEKKSVPRRGPRPRDSSNG
jgi:RNA polymerase sigma factor (sigma-70 family)